MEFCSSCKQQFSAMRLPKILPYCKHKMCVPCIVQLFSTIQDPNKRKCKQCLTPICYTDPNALPDDFDLQKIIMTTSSMSQNVDAGPNNGLPDVHVVGHSWIDVLSNNSSAAVKFGFNLTTQFFGDENTFDSIITRANTGAFQNYGKLVVFGIVPLCWKLAAPASNPSLRLLVPDPTFSFDVILQKMRAFSAAITKFNPTTGILIFFPPVLDINKYNSALVTEAGQSYTAVVKNSPEINPDNVTFHNRSIMGEMHPSKVKANKVPNCEVLYGHNVIIDFNWDVKNNVMNYIKKVSNDLDLNELVPDGLKPNDAFAKHLLSFIGDKFDCEPQKETAIPEVVMEDISAPTTVSAPYNMPSAHAYNKSSDIGVMNNSTSESLTVADIPKDQSVENYFVDSANEGTAYGDSELLEATVEEITRLCKHIQTVRDTCFPNVSNTDICNMAIHTLRQYLQ